MREVEVDADELAFQPCRHLLDELRLGQAVRPFIKRLERYEKFSDEGSIRIGGVFAAALLGNNGADRSITADHIADLVDGVAARIKCDRGREQSADPEIAFFEFRQEFGAKPHSEAAAEDEEGESDHRRKTCILHRQNKNALVDAAKATDENGLNLGHSFRQQK